MTLNLCPVFMVAIKKTSKIRNLRKGLFFCLFILISNLGFALTDYTYYNGFESTPSDTFTFWVANGSYTVDPSSGITTAKHFAGSKSYFLDLTFDTASYVYWQIPVPNVPCENVLKLSGRMWVEQISGTPKAQLGTNQFFPPTTYSGCTIPPASPFFGAWNAFEMDAVAMCVPDGVIMQKVWGADATNVGTKINKIGLFIFGKTGDRIKIYLDEIKLAGTVPDAAAYNAIITSRWAAYSIIFNAKMIEFAADKTAAQSGITNPVPPLTNPNASAFEQELIAEAQARLDYIDANYNFTTITNRGVLAPSEYNGITFGIDQARGIVDAIHKSRASVITLKDHLLYNVDTTKTTFRNILPDAGYIPASIDNNIYITAAPGEYKSASFAVKAFADLSNMTVTVSNLVRSGTDSKTISSGNIDVRVVKCWYQNGIDTVNYVDNTKILVPELLLKDDSLINIITTTCDNYIKLGSSYSWISNPLKAAGMFCPPIADFPVTDSSALLPVNVADNKYKQFWLTVNVPAGTAAGAYTGYITFNTTVEKGKYPVTVNVLPFALENTKIKYSIFYRGLLTTGTGTISSEGKNSVQFSNEMTNMVKHGVKNPTVYQTLSNNVLNVRRNAGMYEDSLYYTGLSTGNSTDPAVLATLRANVISTCSMAAAQPYGIANVYFFGIDEAIGDDLLKQREAWQTVRDAGGKIFVSGFADSLAMQYPYGKCASWHFDEGTGTTAYDSAEKNYGNHGTLVNMDTSTCWVDAGRIGKALAFDGVNDYVDCGYGASLNPGTGDFTYEFWAKSSQADKWVEILNKANGTQYANFTAGWYLTVRHNLTGKPIIYTHTQGGNSVYWYTTPGIGSYFQDGAWHHWVLVGRRTATTGTVELFRDGLSQGTRTPPGNFTSATNITTAENLSIGSKAGYASDHPFQGIMDEVRIYNRALSTTEITRNYNCGVGGHWTTVGDMKDLHAKPGALSTVEVNKAHEVPLHQIFSYGNPFSTVENPEAHRRNYGLRLWQYGYDGVMEYAYQASFNHIWNDFDHLDNRDHNFTYPTTNGVIDTIAWEGFREGADDTRYMATLEKAIADAPASAAKAAAVAFVNDLKGSVRLQYDDLTDIRNEIIDHILSLNGECGSWHFDEGAGPTADDSSANNNNGTLVNIATSCWVDGRIGKALAFDGSNDYVDCGNGTSLNPGTGDFTYEFWAKSSQTDKWVEILNKANGTQYANFTAGWYLTVRHNLTGKPIIYTHTQGGNSVYWYNNIGSYFQDNAWHHWVLVGRRTATTGTVELFRDGLSQGTRTPPGNFTSATNITTAENLSIGSKAGYASDHPFQGIMDEVRIYNRALSATEINQHFNNGR